MSDKYQSYSHYYQTKKTRFWRAIAFTVFICACIFCAFSIFSNNTLDSTDYIAEIAIDGMIVDASNQAEKINDLYDNDQVKAVIIAINSPGGTTYDSEILYDALAKVSQKKPVVAYMKNIAASGGYIVAIAAEKIFAAKNTITGSIGVLMQVPNAKKLLDNIGVSITEIKSSPIKGEPNYFSNTPPEALENLQNMVEDTNLWFQNLVKERRPNIMPENFSSLTNGSVFTGQQAVNNKLIDAIGGQFEAKSYLIKHYKFDESINIESVSLEESSDDFLINQIFNMFMGHFFKTTGNFWPTSRNNVDGLLSLWHS